MRSYRLYLLDDQGHIYKAHDIECADDHAARKEAERAATKGSTEVWERSRLVARIMSADRNQAA